MNSMKIVSRRLQKSSSFILTLGCALAVVLCVYMISHANTTHSSKCSTGASVKTVLAPLASGHRHATNKGSLSVTADGKPVHLEKAADNSGQQSGSSTQTKSSTSKQVTTSIVKQDGKDVGVQVVESISDTKSVQSVNVPRNQNKPKLSMDSSEKVLISSDDPSIEQQSLSKGNTMERNLPVGQAENEASVGGSKKHIITGDNYEQTSLHSDKQSKSTDKQQKVTDTDVRAGEFTKEITHTNTKSTFTQEKKERKEASKSDEEAKLSEKPVASSQQKKSRQKTNLSVKDADESENKDASATTNSEKTGTNGPFATSKTKSSTNKQVTTSNVKQDGKDVGVQVVESISNTKSVQSVNVPRNQNKPKPSTGSSKKVLISSDDPSIDQQSLSKGNAMESNLPEGQSENEDSVGGSKKHIITVDNYGQTSPHSDKESKSTDKQQKVTDTDIGAGEFTEEITRANKKQKTNLSVKDADESENKGASATTSSEKAGTNGPFATSKTLKKIPVHEFCKENDKKNKFEVGQHDNVLVSELPTNVINAVKKFILFVGYPRSGHSIVGSLLDAHPNMVVSNSYAVFKQMLKDPDSHQSRAYLFNGMYRNSVCNFYFGLRTVSASIKGYSLRVDNSWQARYNGTIYAIGDKSGGNTITMYERNGPKKFLELYKQLMSTVGMPIGVIHAVRNPYDIIATMTIMNPSSGVSKLDVDPMHPYENEKLLGSSIDLYFRRAQEAQEIFTLLNLTTTIIEMHNSDLVRKPKETFAFICEKIGVTCSKEFLDVVADKVFPEVSKTRLLIKWTPAQVKKVANEMKRFSFLQRYTFDTD